MKRSKRETITQSEYLQVVGLLKLAEMAAKDGLRIERALRDILQEVDSDGRLLSQIGEGFIGDHVYNLEPDATALLRGLGITVEDQ